METFNILAHQISFDDNIPKYSQIYKKKLNIVDNHTKKYNEFQKKVTTMNELIAYVEKLKAFITNQYNTIADEMIKLLEDNQIYNKTKTEMLSSNRSINQFENLITNINNQIKDYLNSMNIQFEDIKNQNPAEAKKKCNKAINATAQSFQTQIQEVVYKGSMLIIDEMFLYCLGILILNNKISNTIINNIQKENANKIMSNLNNIQNQETKQNQLIQALQNNVFDKEIHSKILEYITEDKDIEEYIKLIKFIEYENIILELCQNKTTNLNDNNNKYVKIINLIDENYIATVKSNSENANQEIAKNIYKFSHTETLLFNKHFKHVFDAFAGASCSVGKLLKQDDSNGHIIIKHSFSLLRMIPPTILDIYIRPKDENISEVTISTLAKFGAILGTPLTWKNKILKLVQQKI